MRQQIGSLPPAAVRRRRTEPRPLPDAPGAARPRRRRIAPRHLLALPSFAWTLLFFAVPLGFLAVYSFGEIDVITFDVTFGWTLDNYERLTDPLYLKAIGRSLAISVGATLGCLLIGYPVALMIARQTGRTQTLLLLAVMVPFWTSFVVRTYAWVNLLSPGGLLGGLDIAYTSWAVAVGMVYTYLPLMILPLYVALERIDSTYEQAAADLGASRWRTFRRVTLPLSMPGVIAGCLMVGIPATGEYTVPAILGGDKILVYGNLVADQFLKVGDYPFGSALAVSLMAILTAFLVFGRLRLARAEDVV
jgi:ABC-type spermidine/putrescine transport system permease subunit I